MREVVFIEMRVAMKTQLIGKSYRRPKKRRTASGPHRRDDADVAVKLPMAAANFAKAQRTYPARYTEPDQPASPAAADSGRNFARKLAFK